MLHTRWRWMVSFTFCPLYSSQKDCVGWAPEPVWTVWRSGWTLTPAGCLILYCAAHSLVYGSGNVMAHGDTRDGVGKWRGNWRMEWVASTLHTTSECGVCSITATDAHTSAATSQLNRPPANLNGLVHFAERQNLVSARVPSHFNWPVTIVGVLSPPLLCNEDTHVMCFAFPFFFFFLFVIT